MWQVSRICLVLPGDYQADLELRSPTNRSPLTGDTAPQAVEVHVYNLGETLAFNRPPDSPFEFRV